MTIEHRLITDAERHEPRGASTAAANTVYHSDGLGSGTWRRTSSNDLLGLAGDGGIAGLHLASDGADGFDLSYHGLHGVMAITNNAVNFPVTAVADTTFNTPSQFSLVTGVGAPWVSEHLNGMTFSVDRLTATVSGIYKIDLWGNINLFPAVNARLCFRYRINGSAFSSRKPTVKTGAASDPQQVSGFGLLSLNAGDYLQLYVASDGTGNVLFSDLNTTLTLIHPT